MEAVASNINQAPTNGGFWQQATQNILGLFDAGKTIYESSTGRTLAGDKIVKETVTPPKQTVNAPEKVFGIFTQNQALLLAAGLTVVLVVSLSRRK